MASAEEQAKYLQALAVLTNQGQALVHQIVPQAASAPMVPLYHGSRDGAQPIPKSGRPFYLTDDPKFAQGYANEAVLTGKAKTPLITKFSADTSKYLSGDEYRSILAKHFPDDSWIGSFPSEAATVAHPPILKELTKMGAKGINGLWDFGMDPMQERPVTVVLDPSSIKENYGDPR